VLAAGLGFATAVCWGLADFLGGLLTRRLALAVVMLVSQLAGLTAIAVVVAVGGLEVPAPGDVAPAIVAGVCQLAGIAALYGALAIGTMSVISPISASGAAILPVIVGIATGERPAGLQVAGMAAALTGAVMATRSAGEPEPGKRSRRALELSAVAALGFGGFYVGMDAAVDSVDPFWALLAARATAGLVLVIVLLCLRPRLDAGRADLPALVLVGLLGARLAVPGDHGAAGAGVARRAPRGDSGGGGDGRAHRRGADRGRLRCTRPLVACSRSSETGS